jgi:hypothetical protein
MEGWLVANPSPIKRALEAIGKADGPPDTLQMPGIIGIQQNFKHRIDLTAVSV